ncbi:MAG: ABC transporter permease [Planctomycetota bacterium]|nr:ABC transporter permease [Planctomycetota bacterium]
MTRTFFGNIGSSFLALCRGLGGFYYLLWDTLRWMVVVPIRGKTKSRRDATFEQMVRVGVRSLPVVCLVLTFVGIILSLNMAEILRRFGVTEFLGNVVGVSIVKELGPLLTAVVMSGYIGAAMAAELGTMRVSEEIMALETSGINPIRFLVVPRLLATMVMLPCVTIVANIMGILGGMIIAVAVLKMDWLLYVARSYESLELSDVFTGLIKAEAFAVVICIIACRQGLTTSEGAEGVGKSTTASVVLSVVFIIVVDCILTALFYFM